MALRLCFVMRASKIPSLWLWLTRPLSKSQAKVTADHISITANHSRQNILAPATITEIKDVSKTVKLLKLNVKEDKFTFKAGQWVDMIIPGVATVGGFSMSSAPDLLHSIRMFYLAIKFSKHPPAYWVHTECQVGDSVEVRVGGDFFYDPQVSDTPSNLVLLAGGVGINPLYSILQHFVHLSSHNNKQTINSKSTLIYSAKTVEDLLFRNELMKINEDNANVTVKLHCTKECKTTPTPSVVSGHIDQSIVEEALTPLDKSKTEIYICGPSSFISDMESYCLGSGVQQHKIHYEKWW